MNKAEKWRVAHGPLSKNVSGCRTILITCNFVYPRDAARFCHQGWAIVQWTMLSSGRFCLLRRSTAVKRRRLEMHIQQAGLEEVWRIEYFDWTAQTLDRRLLDAGFSLDFLPSLSMSSSSVGGAKSVLAMFPQLCRSARRVQCAFGRADAVLIMELRMRSRKSIFLSILNKATTK